MDAGCCLRVEPGNCESDKLDPNCREQPNPVWPGEGQYNPDEPDNPRGIEPMGFTSSEMAYVSELFHLFLIK